MVLLMERKQSTRTLWLVISLVSNFGFLGYFKYSGFITENVNALLAQAGSYFRLPDPAAYPNALLGWFGAPDDWLFTRVVLPIGISFHTFQSMSYTIDAYFGTIQTERSFVRFLTFVSFFPQLVAGPIERAHNLLPQLQRTPTITSAESTWIARRAPRSARPKFTPDERSGTVWTLWSVASPFTNSIGCPVSTPITRGTNRHPV